MTACPPEQQASRAGESKRVFRRRLTIFIIGATFFTIITLFWLLSSGRIMPYDWSYVLSALLVLSGLLLSLWAFLFSLQPIESKQPLDGVSSLPTHTPTNDSNSHNSITEAPPPTANSMNQPSVKLLTSRQKAKTGTVQIQPDSVFQFNVKLTNRNDFFGRKLAREILISRTQKGEPTSIVGPRRIGKTWLITYLILTVPTNRLGLLYRIGYVDATTPMCSTVAGFTARVLEELGISPTQADQSTLNLANLERAVRDLRTNHQVPILCIDEFEGFARSQEFDLNFFGGLRAISRAGLGLVTASKTSLIEIVSGQTKTSPFFNIFEQIRLNPFTIEEAKEFVQAKGKKARFTEHEQEFLLEYGLVDEQQWSPLRLQLAGKMLLADKNHQQCYLDERNYRQDFENRLNEIYKGVMGR